MHPVLLSGFYGPLDYFASAPAAYLRLFGEMASQALRFSANAFKILADHQQDSIKDCLGMAGEFGIESGRHLAYLQELCISSAIGLMTIYKRGEVVEFQNAGGGFRKELGPEDDLTHIVLFAANR